jgi:hypothetical protein
VSALLAVTERMRDLILELEPQTDGSTEPARRAACADAHVRSMAWVGVAETGEVSAEQLASIVGHVALLETLLDTSIAGAAAHCDDVANRLACREEWRSAEPGLPSARHAHALGRRLRAFTAIDDT